MSMADMAALHTLPPPKRKENVVPKPRPSRDTRLRNRLFWIIVVAAIVVGWRLVRQG
ncbi:hypothetical protein [Halomonas sp. WWR20]